MGVVDLTVTVQLLIDAEEAGLVHWDRQFVLRDVWVLDLGTESPRDLYVSWCDYAYSLTDAPPARPLGHLAYMVASGAKIINARRVLPGGSSDAMAVSVEKRDPLTLASVMRANGSQWNGAGKISATGTGPGVAVGGGIQVPAPTASSSSKAVSGLAVSKPPPADASAATEPSLRERLEGRVSAEHRGSAVAKKLVDAMLTVSEVFDALDVSKCTEVIEFKLTGVPKEVSFRVGANRKCGLGEYKERLDIWESRGINERVPWDTPSYGFAKMVPKPGGKWRLTINPTEVNKATEKFTLQGVSCLIA